MWVGSHHSNSIVDHRIKSLNLVSQTLLLHSTRLCSEAVINMLWPLSFKADFQRYNSLDIDKDVNKSEQKFSSVEFQIFPT